MKAFEVSVVEKGKRKFIEGLGGGACIENERDVVDFIGICANNNADRIMLHDGILPRSFFDLKSGYAGMILQKFVNYHIRAAAVLSRDQIRGKFGEFVLETNRGHHFRVFFDRQEAETWLLSE